MEPMLVAKENVPMVLELVGSEIEEIMDTFVFGGDSYLQVVQDLYGAARQLWILPSEENIVQGWLITQIYVMPNEKRLIFDMFGGKDFEVLIEKLPIIEDWARQLGATEALAIARPGLRRKLKPYGFRHISDIVVKPLSGVH